jgi:hypothetical protein
VQTDIAEKIASALDVVLDDEQLKHMRSVGLQNPEAYVAFQKGIELFNDAHGSQDQLEKLLAANKWFEETMSLAPDFWDPYNYHADYYTHLILGGIDGEDTSKEDLDAAMSSLESDLTNAIKLAPDAARRSVVAYDLDLITGRWRGLTSRFEQIVEQDSCYMPTWPEMITDAFGSAAEVRELAQRGIGCDPLSFSSWLTSTSASQWLGDFDSALDTSWRGFETTGNTLLMRAWIESLNGAGRFEEATKATDREIRDQRFQLYRSIRIAAAQGDAIATNSMLDQYEQVANSDFVLMEALAIVGQRDRANLIAAKIDAEPFGYLQLNFAIHNCMCGAPFDLEVTPNYAKLIQEAELPWPPLSPMNWPLKDW